MPEKAVTLQMVNILSGQIKKITDGSAIVKVPRLEAQYKAAEGAHFHSSAELFIQVHGVATFNFMSETLALHPGELMVIPKGIAHLEKSQVVKGQFLNLVGMQGTTEEILSLHFGITNDGAGATPGDRVVRISKQVPRLYSYLNDMVDVHFSQVEAREESSLGLLSACLGGILDVVRRSPPPEAGTANNKVELCQALIREQYSNLTLSVRSLAAEIRCSADYLSHLFYQETGTPLKTYINEERTRQAARFLRTTPMNVAETARACGFQDPSYFTRVFKRFTGHTPKTFQKDLQYR